MTICLSALALVAAFLLNNAIPGQIGRYWWLPLLAAFIYLCLRPRCRLLPPRHRATTILSSAAAIGFVVWYFDDTMAAFMVGAILLFVLLLAHHITGHKSPPQKKESAVILGLVGLSLIWLPISVNRIEVTLPNLSADTYLTLYQSSTDKPAMDARFYNRIDDHLQLTVGLGTQIYFDHPHPAPLLEIEILRQRIVVRIISISYQYRIAYLDMELLNLSGDALTQLQPARPDADFRLQMEREVLLVDHLTTNQSARIQLPTLPQQRLPLGSQVLICLVRLMVWLIIGFAMIVLARATSDRSGLDTQKT